MATTGFWPVKNRLKEVIDYAENPDKTIDKKYVDSDLYATLQYVSNDQKTDKRMYVSGINCNSKRAYERMTATKKRFGKISGNVAYHGYQSFQMGEVTPEEAHKIGWETARRMWGKEYEIVVTTHLNTDNLHNHFVVNSVSFKTGRKFENHISDHHRLREISDSVCFEYGKSVLKEANFYGGSKKEYWLKQSGGLSHRELLKADIDTALTQSTNFKAFETRLKDMGYEIKRDENFAHYSVKAPSWQRAIRLDRLGKEYTPQAIRERLLGNQRYVGYVPFQKPKCAPLLTLEIEYRRMMRMDGIQVLFALVIELCRLITGNNTTKDTPRPLSPAMRQEVVKLDKTLKEYKFLCENHIDSPQEFVLFMEEKREQISALEKERQSIYNRNRHKKSEELNAEARAISAKIKPLREELSLAKAVAEKIPKLKEVIETERQAEAAVLTKNKESLAKSIQAQGIISPLIVRSMEGKADEYEVISGHRRLYAAIKAGLSEVPALIYPIDRNEAMIAVVDSNLHRERILPSEKAYSYKMKMEAMKLNGQADEKITALYCRLSVDDDNKDEESNSITNQKQILQDFARKEGYTNTMFFVDDGVSGTTFQRPSFQRMERMAENGEIGTIIVKDLSRFGREQVEMGRLTQVVYPSLGIRFIAIQERVDTLTGDGAEMMPFHNIFNEWYAAQTSKKIRAVWQSKAEHGERVSPSVPFGYKKSEEDKKQWVIDEPAAEVVRKIYALCLAGRGPSQIARQLEKEQILVPSAYYGSIGRSHAQKVPANPYSWDQKTVVGILEKRQYTGCAVNFKTTTVSYKVHKTIYKPAEEHQIIPNMQEPIISEEQWLRVQELRKHRRRPTATGRTSLFSGLVYCYDCGAKMHFAAAKSVTRNQEHFRCSNYKSGRGECTVHYIRDVVLEKIVFEAISGLADFVKCHETVFLYMLAKKTNAMRQKEHKKLQQAVEQGTRRIAEINRLIEKVFEQNATGILSDERFAKMLQSYEKEQKALTQEVADSQQTLQDAKQKVTDLRILLRTLREMTDITELTPTLVNSLIERIEIHNNDKPSGHCYVKVDIYFTAAGMIDIPTEQEILAMMEEIRENPQDFRFVA